MWRRRRLPLRPSPVYPPLNVSSSSCCCCHHHLLLVVVVLVLVVVAPLSSVDAGRKRTNGGGEAVGFLGNVSSISLETRKERDCEERRLQMTSSVGTSQSTENKRKKTQRESTSLSGLRKMTSSSSNATFRVSPSLLRKGRKRKTKRRQGCRKAEKSRERLNSRKVPGSSRGRRRKNGCSNRNRDRSRRRKGKGEKVKLKRVKQGRREQRKGWRSQKRRGRRRDDEDYSEEEKSRRQFFVAISSRRRILLRGNSRYTNARLYGKWSRWSPCTRSCTTQRFRWCKRPLQCGTDVVREEAYCYIEGSFCQRWIQRKIHQKHDTDDNEADVDITPDNSNSQPPYASNPTQPQIDLWFQKDCGMPMSNRTSFLAIRRHQQSLRIIGGRESTPGRWPWQVAVLNRFKEAFCGGTLVAPQWVLTAAHCIRKRLYVRLGEHDLAEDDGTEAEYRVEEAIIHPEYDADTVDNDVALLRLPSWASSNRHNGGGPRTLACLPRPRQPLPLRRLCTIIGWGKRKSSDAFGTDILHEAEVPIVSNEICRDVYEDYYITGNMFCAGYHKGRMDSCAGDSGGPLLCLSGRGSDGSNPKWTIFGITSFGEGCGKRGKYGIYTKVSNYVRWVQRVVKGYYGNGKY